jgi:hypothetical protein
LDHLKSALGMGKCLFRRWLRRQRKL